MELQRALPAYRRQGIAVYAVSYDPVAVLARFAGQYGIAYPLLSDAGSRAIAALGLLNRHITEQQAAYGRPVQERHLGTPYPGVFFLDARGHVVQKRFHQSYRERETGFGLLERGFGAEGTGDEGMGAGPVARAGIPPVAIRVQLDSPIYRYMQRLWLTVKLALPPGVHVYASPAPAGLQALTLTVVPAADLVVGEAEGPDPQLWRPPGEAVAVPVYAGEPAFAIPLTFTAAPGDRLVWLQVALQACSESECFPPGSLALSLPLASERLVEGSQ